MRYSITYKPSSDDFDYVKNWMKADFEKEVKGSGLYYNIEQIKKYFDEGHVCVLRIKGKAEGFVTYSNEKSRIITFEYLSVNSEFHHMGFGTKFMKRVINHFRKKGMLMATIYSPSNNGLRLAKKMGFQNVFDWNNNRYDKDYYKYLVPKRRQNNKAKYRLVLWTENNLQNSGDGCSYSWSLDFTRNKKPILIQTSPDSTVGLFANDQEIQQTQVKRLQKNTWYPEGRLLCVTFTESQSLLSRCKKA